MEIVKNTLRKSPFVENYRGYTDKYFLRSKEILKKENINPLVRYQVFSRKNIYELEGINEAVSFIKGVAGDKVKVYSMQDGQNYIANQPMMKLEGRAQDLIDIETVYLGILSGNLTGELDFEKARENAREIREAAQGKKVLYFGARHFHPKHDEKLARICQEEGFDGTSTDVGAKAWNAKGGGTIPHALVLAYKAHIQENEIYGNATVEATKAFDKHIDKNVPRYLLNCTFNREITDTIKTAKALPNLKGTRIDTCGENVIQGSYEVKLPEDLDVPLKYINGTGVKINGVWGLRETLDSVGLGDLEIVVSSGFNPEKTKAFMKADVAYQEKHGKPLFTTIGTGSLGNPVMTTSDIYSYFSEKENKWKPLSKTGRTELLGGFLEEM